MDAPSHSAYDVYQVSQVALVGKDPPANVGDASDAGLIPG